MALQYIDISSPNDGQGDPLRSAFNMQNQMNEELYGTKVDKVTGQGLTDNNYTDAEQLKLDGIEEGAEVNVQSSLLQEDNTADDYIIGKETLPYPKQAGTIEIYQKGYLNGVKNANPLALERGDLGKMLLSDGNSVIGVWRIAGDGQDWANYEQLGGYGYDPVTD